MKFGFLSTNHAICAVITQIMVGGSILAITCSLPLLWTLAPPPSLSTMKALATCNKHLSGVSEKVRSPLLNSHPVCSAPAPPIPAHCLGPRPPCSAPWIPVDSSAMSPWVLVTTLPGRQALLSLSSSWRLASLPAQLSAPPPGCGALGLPCPGVSSDT